MKGLFLTVPHIWGFDTFCQGALEKNQNNWPFFWGRVSLCRQAALALTMEPWLALNCFILLSATITSVRFHAQLLFFEMMGTSTFYQLLCLAYLHFCVDYVCLSLLYSFVFGTQKFLISMNLPLLLWFLLWCNSEKMLLPLPANLNTLSFLIYTFCVCRFNQMLVKNIQKKCTCEYNTEFDSITIP